MIAIDIATSLYLSVHHGEPDVVCTLADDQTIRYSQASGVQVADACNVTFQELKLGKKHKYIIFNLNKDFTEIVVEKCSSESNYEKFLENLPEKECRWAVYDFDFEKDGKRNKLCFISWSVASIRCNCSLVLILVVPWDFIRSPDDAKVRPKMVFASSRDALKRKLDGISLEIQGTDPSEVSYETGLLAFARTRCCMLISTRCSSRQSSFGCPLTYYIVLVPSLTCCIPGNFILLPLLRPCSLIAAHES